MSPWITDIKIIDNETGSFAPLDRWGPRGIRLAEVLATLAARGSSVIIGTTSDPHNEEFIEHLIGHARGLGVENKIRISRDTLDLLHVKAITGDDYALVGSMNITWYGVNLREEYLELRNEEDFVADAKLDARERFGIPS